VSTAAWREQQVADIARELVPDGFEQPNQADTWRFGSLDEGFVVYFGSWEDDKTVRVHASIQIPDHKIDCFTALFLQAVMEYCEHKNIELDSVKISPYEEGTSPDRGAVNR
jgi:hypothetical protein